MKVWNPIRVLTLVLLPGLTVSAATLTIRSGNGTVGGTDSQIKVLIGPLTGDMGHTFTAADFAAAENAQPASVISPNQLWLSGLKADPAAKWIGPNSLASATGGRTGLYAISFQVPPDSLSASLNFTYAADNTIGEFAFGGPNTGVYINGTSVCGTSFFVSFDVEHTVNCGNVTQLLRAGTNWLYIEGWNGGGPSGLIFSATLTTTTAPTIKPGGIVNSTTLGLGGTIAPGSIASILGSFPVATSAQAQTTGAIWPTALSAVSVEIDGILAPLYYVSNSLIHFEVPWELAGRNKASVTVVVNGLRSAPASATIGTFGPGIYSMNGQGTGPGAILDSSFRLVDATNPATPGAYLQIYATGMGAVTNRPPSGHPAPVSTLSWTTTMPVVAVGGIAAPALFSGLVPTAIGYYQINFQVPAGTPLGDAVPVTMSMAGIPSNTVTIALKAPTPPNPVPTITSLSPSSALSGSGPLTITITGTGFIASSSVTFCAVPHAVTFVDGSHLQIKLSASDLAGTGACAVVVSNPPPGGGVSGGVSFPIPLPSNPAPTITSLSPLSASAGSGQLVVAIVGTGFMRSTIVTFNGTVRASTFVSATQLRLTLGTTDLKQAGAFTVTVQNPAPGGGTSSFPFNVVQILNPAPTITSLSPASAPAGLTSLTLTINGAGYMATSTVTVGGVRHPSTFVSPGQVTIVLNNNELSGAGTLPVAISNAGPGGGTATATFNVTSEPAVSVTGTWRGTWGSLQVPLTGQMSAAFSQTGANFGGTITIGSFCFSSVQVVGYVEGYNIVAVTTLASPAEVVFVGGANTAGNQIKGAYKILTGPCAEDIGLYLLNKE